MVSVPKIGYAGVLGFVVFVSFIEMIIAAVLVSSYNRGHYPTTHLRDVIRYTLFVSIWTILTGSAYAYFSLMLSTSIVASVASNAAFVFLTWLFWLASGASTANALGGPLSCSNKAFAHCHQLLALEAFAWIEFIVLTFTFGILAFLGYQASRKGDGFTGPLDTAA
ncbi:MAG: hypothetical protein CYPHOPRED_004105 [Cyphobasidiales sp. Tagirdzhanova-0007]|nr:MAG: hypothetical protein CYPHOPRED_004105 [Cyphobasidiales sp. Tagirdzhanova-0007]